MYNILNAIIYRCSHPLHLVPHFLRDNGVPMLSISVSTKPFVHLLISPFNTFAITLADLREPLNIARFTFDGRSLTISNLSPVAKFVRFSQGTINFSTRSQ